MSKTIKQVPITKETLIEASEQLYSIQDFVRWIYTQFASSQLFYGHGTDNPWDEAVALTLQTLELPSDTPEYLLTSRLTQSEKQLLVDRVERRINQRVPLAYLTNKAYFCGQEFFVDERVLVPRSPIAELIENDFQPWVKPESVTNILDLCTGSGCIAIACAQYFPQAQVDAGDISSDCIEVAEVNKAKYQQENVCFYQSDLFDSIPTKKYQIIVSNPPYVDQEDFDGIPKEFLAEPKLGLVSGKDGLDITRRLLKQASHYLDDNGILVVEVGNSAAALVDAYPDLEFIWLEFERGGHGVFALTKAALDKIA
jgi:ribosomal protein L3 glutamine methyltransferase